MKRPTKLTANPSSIRPLLVVALLAAVTGLVTTPSDTAEAHNLYDIWIWAQNSGKCVRASGTANLDPIYQWSCTSSTSPPSRIDLDILDAGGGWHQIRFRDTGKCLDVPGASTQNSVQLIQYTCHSGDNQKFPYRPLSARRV